MQAVLLGVGFNEGGKLIGHLHEEVARRKGGIEVRVYATHMMHHLVNELAVAPIAAGGVEGSAQGPEIEIFGGRVGIEKGRGIVLLLRAERIEYFQGLIEPEP